MRSLPARDAITLGIVPELEAANRGRFWVDGGSMHALAYRPAVLQVPAFHLAEQAGLISGPRPFCSCTFAANSIMRVPAGSPAVLPKLAL